MGWYKNGKLVIIDSFNWTFNLMLRIILCVYNIVNDLMQWILFHSYSFCGEAPTGAEKQMKSVKFNMNKVPKFC